MGNNCSTQGRGSQDGLTYHVRRIIKGIENDFIDTYLMRIAVIIEHYEVYQDFYDKIPEPICLAEEFLQDCVSHFNESEKIDISEFVRSLAIRSKQYVKKNLHQIIRQICKEIFQHTHEAESHQVIQTNNAEKRLRDYEVNVLRIINRLSKQDFEYCNHLKVAKQVIDELITQVKRNGVNDNNGKDINDYPSYIYKIVKSRMNDEKKRNQRLRSFPGQNFDCFESQNGEEYIENKVIIDELQEYLGNNFFPKINDLEGFVFRTYYLEDECNQSKIKESIYNIFGINLSVASISRMLKRLIGMISEDLFCTSFAIDNFYEMAKESNLSPLKADWLFLFLDANHVNLRDELGKKKECTHFIGYGISREAKEEILINKVFSGHESLELWQQVLLELKNRGMARLLMMITGDYPNFVSFTREFFPKVDHQLSLYQLQNNAHRYLRRGDYALFKTTFEDILSSASFDEAYDRLIQLCRKLNKTSREIASNLEEKAENFLAFVKYPSEIWKTINIFKIDESLNKNIKTLGQDARKKHYKEKELIAKTKMKIDKLLKSDFKDYDYRLESVLPQLTSIFNKRFQLPL